MRELEDKEVGKSLPPLRGMPEEYYYRLKGSGMFWEWYPDATGIYTKDCEEGHTL